MFLGHVAVGLAAKKVAPKAPLAWLVAAPGLLDLLWPVFLAVGLEEVRIAPGITAVTPLDFVRYPISHSLLLSIVWGLLAAGFYFASQNDRTGTLVVIYFGNVFGPPPPGVAALNAVAFAGFLIPVWAGWFDRHRDLGG